MNVQGHFKEDFDQLKDPGDFMFSEGETTIIFMCPCGCGDHVGVGTSRVAQAPKVWLLTGPKETPTLSPSIQRCGDDCHWHGFLRNGVWEQC